jgi:hypothetical protein
VRCPGRVRRGPEAVARRGVVGREKIGGFQS